jgi:hypothetical protein
LQIKSTIAQRRTACTGVRETEFLRGGPKKPGFFHKSKLGSKDWGKNPVSDLCAGGQRNRVFSINQNWEANIVAKTRFLILDNII